MESFESRIERDSIFSARQAIHALHNTVSTMSFFRKMQKDLAQKYNSESHNNQPIIEFLQSTATSGIGRVDMQVISDFVFSEKSVNRSPQYRK